MRRFGLVLALVLAAFTGCGGSDRAAAPTSSASRPAPVEAARAAGFDERRAWLDLRAQVRIGPRPAGSSASAREVKLIVSRLRAARIRDVRVQRPYRNVVAKIPGKEPGTVVIGAHHDTKDIPGFVGANDGASGVAVLLELARDLPRRLHGPSISLVFFDAEEARDDRPFDLDGARGSAQFIRYARRNGLHGSPPLGEIRAMVLFDLVGDCKLSIPREANSDPGLYQRFADASQDVTGSAAPFVGSAAAILDDHIPFIDAGVPSVDLIDLDFGPGPAPGSYWHTPEDSLRHVCPRSLAAVGSSALAALPGIR
jgi:glutaminyl-peptide cyclotransferase